VLHNDNVEVDITMLKTYGYGIRLAGNRVVINDGWGINLSYKDVTDGRTVGSVH
jgi:hypothetical protein